MNFLELPDDIQEKIIYNTNISCHTCYKKFTSIHEILNCKKVSKFRFCSKKCYLHC